MYYSNNLVCMVQGVSEFNYHFVFDFLWHAVNIFISLYSMFLPHNLQYVPNYWHERRRCSRLMSGGRLATTLVDRYFHHYFLFGTSGGVAVGCCQAVDWQFSIFNFFFHSPSRPFLIEGVLGSKNLFSESCLKWPHYYGEVISDFCFGGLSWPP